MKIHLVSGVLGPAETAPLAVALHHLGATVSEEAQPLPESISGAAVTNAYLTKSRRPPIAADLVVGVREGAGYASRIAAREPATRLVLLDPELEPVGVHAPAMARHLSDHWWERVEAMAKALEPYEAEISSGNYSTAATYLLFGGSDPSTEVCGCIAAARFAGHSFDPEFQPTPEAVIAADWVQTCSTFQQRCAIWLSSHLQELVDPFTNAGWPARSYSTAIPWLNEPQTVAQHLIDHCRPA